MAGDSRQRSSAGAPQDEDKPRPSCWAGRPHPCCASAPLKSLLSPGAASSGAGTRGRCLSCSRGPGGLRSVMLVSRGACPPGCVQETESANDLPRGPWGSLSKQHENWGVTIPSTPGRTCASVPAAGLVAVALGLRAWAQVRKNRPLLCFSLAAGWPAADLAELGVLGVERVCHAALASCAAA